MTETSTPDTDAAEQTIEAECLPALGFRRVLSTEQMGVLMSDLHRSRVATRSVSGRNQSYVEAYDIKATLIRVFGFGGFSVECDSKILDIRDDGRQGTYATGDKMGQPKTPYVMAQATVKLTIHNFGPAGQDVVYTESSIGTNDGWTIGDVADNAIKSAASDALKRCAIYLGTQFGLGLYNNGSQSEIVRQIFEPEQRAIWLEAVGARVPDPVAEQQLAESLGVAEPANA